MPSRALDAWQAVTMHHRVAHAHDDGAVGLLGQSARLDGEGVLADLNLAL